MDGIILVDPLKFIAEYETSVNLTLCLPNETIELGKAIFLPSFYLSSEYRYFLNLAKDTIYLYSDYYESLLYFIGYHSYAKYKYESGLWSVHDMETGTTLTAKTLKELELKVSNFYSRLFETGKGGRG